MANLLELGATWLGDQLKDSAGREVTYVRKSSRSEAIVAVPHLKVYEVVETDSSLTLVESTEWTFVKSEIVINEITITPRNGDEVRETINGVEVIYEVRPMGKMPCFELADPSGVLLTVHSIKAS